VKGHRAQEELWYAKSQYLVIISSEPFLEFKFLTRQQGYLFLVIKLLQNLGDVDVGHC
jgi:hypothetical protein